MLFTKRHTDVGIKIEVGESAREEFDQVYF